ncbi:hypothetical protein [Luteolibacter sp. AS25]|uniref:hypothetical protein n=1 Tax=Luteolibacter sp. AS25 TaxID=3135776 RepID=UPI00398A7179
MFYRNKPLLLSCLLLSVSTLSHAQSPSGFYDLDFSGNVQATNGNQATLGPFYDGTTLDFVNVSPTSGESIDLRTTVTTQGDYFFYGSFPDYSTATGEPDGDLGYVYGANSAGTGGINYQLDFFQGGGTFSDSLALNDFRLMIYDVDGEDIQSESVIVDTADGFYGYQLPTSNDVAIVDIGGGKFRFTGPGVNRPETDPSAAVILFFRNTSTINLTMESTTSGETFPNYVFSAIDGDLSLLGNTPQDFGSFTAVPEVSTTLLGCLGSLLLMRRRR